MELYKDFNVATKEVNLSFKRLKGIPCYLVDRFTEIEELYRAGWNIRHSWKDGKESINIVSLHPAKHEVKQYAYKYTTETKVHVVPSPEILKEDAVAVVNYCNKYLKRPEFKKILVNNYLTKETIGFRPLQNVSPFIMIEDMFSKFDMLKEYEWDMFSGVSFYEIQEGIPFFHLSYVHDMTYFDITKA